MQLPVGATVLPEQLSFDIANSVALLEVIVPIKSPMLPVLLIVKVFAAEDEPTFTLPKATGDAGVTTMFDASPVPLRLIEKVGVSASLDGMLKVALLGP